MARTASKIIKEIPAKETVWVRCRSPNGEEYLITSNQERSTYFLYKTTKDGVERIAKDRTPSSFDTIIYTSK